ncbi:MAG: DNA-binding protein [Candidatus Omnitrophota bacterium]|nr:DNA-binding protein [Candidatus Omnitrophota bacterium]
MMRKIIFIFLIIGFSLSVFCFLCYAEDISSAELINNARQYDGKVVIYKGEVIGDIMMRKEFVWINVNDGVNAIGIWSNKDLARDIVYTGNYKSRGDIVEVKGVFHRACLEHGGDLDIHIDELRKINSGMVIRERPAAAKIKQAFVLLGMLGLALILRRLKKEKHK